jgi:hypothetical protein
LPRYRFQTVGIFWLAALALAEAMPQSTAPANSKSPDPESAVVTSVRLVQDEGVPSLEVISTRPVVPAIQFLDSPPRLVIDLSNTRIGLLRKRVPVLKNNILAIRAEQFQKDPPIVRLVLDLLIPYGYTWDEAGNRLMVRLKPAGDAHAFGKKSPFQPPPGAGERSTAAPEVAPGTAPSNVVYTGSQFAGSALTAGADTAIWQLSRGGEVRICPGTTVSITPAKNTHDLMLGLSTGALETHYALDASADTVLTPDFRILFAGPGEFDYAISADAHGNTCVRTLMGNTSSAIVSELMGDRIYQVKPNEQAVFHSGKIDQVDTNVPLECGCPPAAPALRADASPSGDAANSTPDQTGATLSSGPETRPLPASQPNEVQVQVEAPFVFRGHKAGTAPPAPTDEAALLPVLEWSLQPVQLQEHVQPPAAPVASTEIKPTPRHPILKRIKGFFAALFR